MTSLISEVGELVARLLGLDHVRPEDRVVEDLGAESLDQVAIAAELEDTFGVSLDEERLAQLTTVRDLADEVARQLAGGEQSVRVD